MFWILHFLDFFLDTMPSLPQAAFAVCKIREQNARSSDNGDSYQSMDAKPVKYNEKYMNAIWGNLNF